MSNDLESRFRGIANVENCGTFLNSFMASFARKSGHMLIDTTDLKLDVSAVADLERAVVKLFDMTTCTIHCTPTTTPQDIVNTVAIDRRSHLQDDEPILIETQYLRSMKPVRRRQRSSTLGTRPSVPEAPRVRGNRESIGSEINGLNRALPHTLPAQINEEKVDGDKLRKFDFGAATAVSAIDSKVSKRRGGSMNLREFKTTRESRIAKRQPIGIQARSAFHAIWIITDIHLANPNTRQYLLQAMSRNLIPVDNRTQQLPQYHRVIATRDKNRRLPNQFLDAFFFELEGELFFEELGNFISEPDNLRNKAPLVSWGNVEHTRNYDSIISVESSLKGFTRDIVSSLRCASGVHFGPSMRAALDFEALLKLNALLSADRCVKTQNFVKPQDFAVAAIDTLAHRTIAKHGPCARELVERLVNEQLLPPK